MGNPTVFFEVAGPDQKGLIDFYNKLFGWKTTDIPGDMPYSMVTPGEGGAPGGIGPTPDGSQGHVTFYVDVDDIAGSLAKAEAFEGMDYGTISADDNGGGIPGGIGSAQDSDASYQTVYAGVDDVEATLKKAESLGAKTVVPTMQIPNGPTIALFADPQGHTFGLVKP